MRCLLLVLAVSVNALAEDRLSVKIYVGGSGAFSRTTMMTAEATASRVFKAIGIDLRWKEGKPCDDKTQSRPECRREEARVVVVTVASGLSKEDLRQACLGKAFLFETPPRIVVFYDRLAPMLPTHKQLGPILLGHVLVHELTHVFQGVARHSDSGIMKARWNNADFGEMLSARLAFTSSDVDMIHLGLGSRNHVFSVEGGLRAARTGN
jgi:hypothetical protein